MEQELVALLSGAREAILELGPDALEHVVRATVIGGVIQLVAAFVLLVVAAVAMYFIWRGDKSEWDEDAILGRLLFSAPILTALLIVAFAKNPIIRVFEPVGYLIGKYLG